MKSDPAMFTTNRVIKRVEVIRHGLQPFEGFCKLPVLSASTPLALIDQAELTETVVRCGVKLAIRIRLIQCQGE